MAAEKKCRSAKITADNAALLAGQNTDGKAETLEVEWKECSTSIDRFDKILVDLRKTGISFVTTIIGGAAFLLTYSGTAALQGTAQAVTQTSLAEAVPVVKVSIFFVIGLLNRAGDPPALPGRQQ